MAVRDEGSPRTLYDAATGKKLVEYAPTETQKGFGQPLQVRTSAVSADGAWAATAGGDEGTHEAFLWKTTGPAVVRRLAAASWFHDGRSVGWLADGSGVAWGGADDGKGTVRAFQRHRPGGEARPRARAWSGRP